MTLVRLKKRLAKFDLYTLVIRYCGSSVVVVTVLESTPNNATATIPQYDVHVLENLAIGTRVMALPVRPTN